MPVNGLMSEAVFPRAPSIPPAPSPSRHNSPVPPQLPHTSLSTLSSGPATERTASPSHSAPHTPRPASSLPSKDEASDSCPPAPLKSSTMSRLGRIQYESSPLSGRPSMPGSSNSAPAGSISLLSSVDSYISPPPSSFLGNGTTLQDLAKLVKHEAYKRHKRAQCRIRLHRSLISTALHARLIKLCRLSHALLVEQLKEDQKQEFARLYNAILDVRNSCEMFRRYALLEQDYDPAKEKEAKEDDEKPKELVSFLHETPLQARDTVLSFLSRLRSSPTFLANRLSKLSQSDLDSLAKIHNPIDTADSVIPTARGSSRGSSSQSRTPAQSTVENVLTFRRNDALHIMIHSLFANPDGPGSQEEQMRIDVWSTACARLLIDGNKKTDAFLFAVLDTWAALREWPALSNFETCIMTLLQEGAFLLNTEETTVKGVTVSTKNEFAVEEFQKKGVAMIFDVLDDEPSAGGIPDAVLSFGNAILEKIEDPKRKKNAEYTLLVKWFFGHYLKDAIVYPEHHGIMVGHHISEHARLKILRPLCSKMFKAAFGTFSVFDAKQSSPVDPSSRAHVENLLARFRTPRPAEAGPLLVSTKNGAAPKEGNNVQNFVAICPADIMTLYNALYPKQPSNTADPRDIVKRGPLSISGSTARSFAKSPASSTFDMASMFSRSSSSVTSESASMMPLLEKIGSSIQEDRVSMHSQLSPVPAGLLTGPSAPAPAPHLDHSENFGAELKNALDSMTGKVSAESLTWRFHPCAEDWSILFVSPDGKELSLRMKSEWADDEEDEDEGVNESDSDDDDAIEMSAMDREYHQLKQAILKLVQDYEIPEDLESEDAAEKIRRNNSMPVITMPGTTPPDEMSHFDPSNPYHASNLTAMFASDKKKDEQLKNKAVEEPQKPQGALLTMLQAATKQCLTRGEYVSAQQYHRALTQLRKLTPSLARDGFSPLMHIFSRGARDAIDRAERSIKEADTWFVWLSLTQERHDAIISQSIKAMRTLRDKMWYVTDVRNSAAYEEAKNVAIALKKMGQTPSKGMPAKASSGKSSRSLAHRASHLSLLKSEGVMELLAAAPEHGGPNKLSDEQAEITSSYLQKFSVENFCKGEERIHRFCCEIDRCVNKLVGDGILDGPVLWSSELYARDERELSMPKSKGNFFMMGECMSPADSDHSPSTWKSRELLKKSSTGNMFSLASQGRSHTTGNFAAAQRSRSKSNASDFGDRDVFGMPTLSLSSSETYQTFWSPFSSAPPTIVVPARPKTSQSNIVSPGTSTPEKRKFLSGLKQSLTGLLLSDLGVEVWSKGSETDQWFSGSYVEECIQRKIEQEEAAKKKLEAAGLKRMRKSKSKKNLRTSVQNRVTDSGHESVGHESQQSCEESAASDATSRSIRSNGTNATAVSKKTTEACSIAFPYQEAFKKLLKKFSAHPNPFEKLHILYDLELLIISSLTSKNPQLPVLSFRERRSLPPSPLLAPVGDNSRVSALNLPESSNVEQAIANIEERRSHAIGTNSNTKDTSTSRSGTPTRSRSPTQTASIPNTDKIVEVLQELFRQNDVRPATLFRDLQYVAAFVPASILDMTEMGKAFWDTGLAALGIKQDVKNIMVITADEIVKHHTKQRNSDATSRTGKEREREETSFYERYSMEDAAKMWMITAKEGDPTAQRELAIFYLTHPTLLPRITKPLSKPKEVFRSAQMNEKAEDPDKRDPATMCTAYHWMELSSEGGDLCAKSYIKQQSW